MLSLTVPSTIPRRATLALALLVALGALATVAWLPSAAHAGGCTDSWVAKGSGSWFAANNWSKKAVPTTEDEVCITESGSYTVEMHQTSTVTVKSLTIGGSENTQTLVVASTNGLHAVLTTSAGITNGSHGAITLTNSETSGNNVTIVGPVSNSGTITTEKAIGGQRNLQGNLTNAATGTLAINTNTSFNASKAALMNEGTLDVASGVQLIASNEGSVTNASGTIAATGTGDVLMEPATTFTEGGGTTSGSKPVIIRDAALKYTGSGESLIAQHGEAGTLSGNLSKGQSLVIESTNGEHAKSTASASFTNGGSITLTNSETSGNNATLAISSGTLTNSGTITTEKAIGGQRNLQGNLTNTATGTLAIHTNTSFNASKAALMNEGTLDVASGVQLIASNEGSVTNASGTIAATGTGDVLMEPATTFTEGGGTTSGSKPVIIRDAALKYTGSGESLIAQHGEAGTLSGNLSKGQSLVIESTNGEHAKSTASASFTNGGSITLTNSETSGNNATLAISSGTLTNSGTITSEKAIGGQRNLQGNLTNTKTGTLAINANTTFNASNATLINEGAIDIAIAVALSAPDNATISNEAGGLITTPGTGSLVETTGTFNQGQGTTSTVKGSQPVILDRVALHYTGSGKSLIAQRGASTLSGPVGKAETLVIESTNGEHAEDTAAGSFTNSGTIIFTNVETSGNNVTLKMGAGTLDNKAKLEVLFPHGGTRTIEGSLTNEKTLMIANNGNPLRVTGKFSQGSTATLKLTMAGSTNFGHLSVGEAVAVNGKLALKQSKFTAKEKETFAIITGASRTGEFSSVTGNAVKGGLLHYLPHYTATGVNLVVE